MLRADGADTARTRWKFYDGALLWLFPLSYVLHIVEEWMVPARIALWHVRASGPCAAECLAANATGLLLMVGGVRLATKSPRFHWIVAALATAVLLNTAGHLVGATLSREYSAGLASAVALWIPLGLLTLLRIWDQSTTRTVLGGALVGGSSEAVVLTVVAR